MLKWLRREVNRDLRYWRSEPGALPHDRYHALIEDCKAKLAMLKMDGGTLTAQPPDWREMFGRYLRIVGEAEGVTFIKPADWSAAELTEIRALQDET